MAYTPNNPNGQATMANSAPVVIASNQTSVPIRATTTDFYFSTGNTSSVQLAAGASFTGVIESVTGYNALSIIGNSDQRMRVDIQQYIDLAGTRLSSTTSVIVEANQGISKSLVMNCNYVRVVATNLGASTTTTFSIDTAYGEIDSATKNGAMAVGSDDDVLIGQAAQTATVNNILTSTSGTAAINVEAYRSFSCQVVSTGTGGTFIFEGSNTGLSTDFQPIPVYNQALVVRVPIVTAITASASQIIYEGSCNFRFLRLRIATTITGGSIQAFTCLMSNSLGTTAQIVSNGTAANLLTTVSGSLTSAGTTTNTPATPTVSTINSAATTNATSVKSSAGTVYGVLISNINAAARFVKFYNKASAPTVGTDTPIITIQVPANTTINFPIGELGLRFATGIALAITGAAADSDTTAVAANEIKVLTTYI